VSGVTATRRVVSQELSSPSGSKASEEYFSEAISDLIARGGKSMECAFCAGELDHCHGTLVVHLDGGFTECSEDGCVDLDFARHTLTIECFDVDGGCTCTEVEARLLPQAS